MAATEAAVTDLIPALDHLRLALLEKSTQWRGVVKSGHAPDGCRTGDPRSGVRRLHPAGRGRYRPDHRHPATRGRTADRRHRRGHRTQRPRRIRRKVVAELRKLTDVDALALAKDNFGAQAARDGLVELSGQLKTVAVSLTKIANDVRWMGSGPLTGLGEIALPDLQPGSSIMPGRSIPFCPRLLRKVAAQVIGNDAAVTWGSSNGAFELNVYIPMMARNVLESIKLLASVSRLFADRCISGLVANEDRLRTLAESSPSIVTPLNSAIGYEEAAAVAKQALKEGKTIRQTVIDRGLIGENLSEAELDARLDVLKMANVDRKPDLTQETPHPGRQSPSRMGVSCAGATCCCRTIPGSGEEEVHQITEAVALAAAEGGAGVLAVSSVGVPLLTPITIFGFLADRASAGCHASRLLRWRHILRWADCCWHAGTSPTPCREYAADCSRY